MHFQKRFIMALCAFSLPIALCGCQVETTGNSQDQSGQADQAKADPSSEDVAASLWPANEASLFAIPEQAEASVKKAPNDYRANQLVAREDLSTD